MRTASRRARMVGLGTTTGAPVSEFYPRLSVVNGSLEIYDDKPVVVNSQEYLASVASLGGIPYALAAIVLAYLVLSYIIRGLCAWYKIFIAGESEEEDWESGLGRTKRDRHYSRSFLDKVRVGILFLSLMAFVACFVSLLYGSEMLSLTDKGTGALTATLKTQEEDLLAVLNLTSASSSLATREKGEVLRKDFVSTVSSVVTSNDATLDESYTYAAVLIYLVPSVVVVTFVFSLMYAFRICECEVSPGFIVPWIFVVAALCLGASLGLPSLYSDVCAEAGAFGAKMAALGSGGEAGGALGGDTAAFVASVYPCTTAAALFGNASLSERKTRVATSALALANDLRSHANGLVQTLNLDLQSVATKASLGSSLRQICAPYAALPLYGEEDCGASGAALSGMKEMACALNARGNHLEGGEALPTAVYEASACNGGLGKPLAELLKGSDGYYYLYKEVMGLHGVSYVEMRERAVQADEAMALSDAILRGAGCHYSEEALSAMCQYGYGNRCDRLDFVSTVFWIANSALVFVLALLGLCLEILRCIYADIAAQKVHVYASGRHHDWNQTGETGTTGSTTGAVWSSDVHNYSDLESTAASAPPMPGSPPASAPVMGYAIAMPQHSHATAISPRNGHYHVMPNRVPSYRIPEPSMKVF